MTDSTLIPLDAPVWERLYGPYGIDDVSDILCSFQTRWDRELAQDLFWERLHHQESVYPVTYAAVPWLFSIAPNLTPEQRAELLIFLSWVIRCMLIPCDLDEGRGKFNGLSLSLRDHHHHWIPRDQWLIAEDMDVLLQLHQSTESALSKWRNLLIENARSRPHVEAARMLIGAVAIDGDYALADAFEIAATGDGWISCPACGALCVAWWRDGELSVASCEAQPERPNASEVRWVKDSAKLKRVCSVVLRELGDTQPEISSFIQQLSEFSTNLLDLCRCRT